MTTGILHRALIPSLVAPNHEIPRRRARSVASLLALLCIAARLVGAEPEFNPAEMALVRQLREKILSAAKAADSAPKPYVEPIPGTIVSFSMVPIPAGGFMLGSPANEQGRKPDEGPQKKISLPAFWMGKHEVTWDEYELFMFAPDLAGSAESGGVDGVSSPTKPYTDMSFGMGIEGFPAVCMTHHAAAKFCEWLSAKTLKYYRLPTEAEWEYAARAGTTTMYSFGNDAASLAEYACFQAEKYAKVGTKKPNPWGLYDMHGNVWEWCSDWYAPALPGGVDPTGAATGHERVFRGGDWFDNASRCRSACRSFFRAAYRGDPYIGLRVVCSVSGP